MARLGKRERMAKRAVCERNRLIIQANLSTELVDLSRQVIRTHAGSLIVVSGGGKSSDHHERLKAHAQTRGFSEARKKLRAIDKGFLKL